WIIEVRNGDTDTKTKVKQTKNMPDVLVITPESLHLLFAQKARNQFFKSLQCIVVDEWHELLGSKRGVLVELALAYLKSEVKNIRIWGITATIGNIEQALEVLLRDESKTAKVVAKEKKKIDILPVYPDEVELLPWAGHLGSKLADKVAAIILESTSCLVF